MAERAAVRRDKKHRILKNGESIRPNGKYLLHKL